MVYASTLALCLSQGCGVGVGVGVGLLRVLRVGVGVGFGIFCPTPTPDVQFLYVLMMLTAQLTRPRAAVECNAVIFLSASLAVYRATQRATYKNLLLDFKQIVFCATLWTADLVASLSSIQ